MLSEEEKLLLFQQIDISSVIVNWLSIFAAAAVVGVILSALAIDKKTMNRVSIRITLVISILDILRSTLTLLFIENGLESWECVMEEMAENFLTLVYFFLNMCIAVNLHLIFLKGYSFNPLWERGYWIGSFGLAMLLSSVAPAGYFAGVQDSSSCIGEDDIIIHVWEWTFLYSWILMVVIYCSIIFLLVIIKLVRNERSLSRALETSSSKGDTWQAARYNSVIRSLLYRITLYCAIPVLTHIFAIVNEIDTVIHGSPKLLLVLIRVITTGLPGVLNFVAFIADPAFRQACQAFRVYFQTLPFEQTNPQPPPQKTPSSIALGTPRSSTENPSDIVEVDASPLHEIIPHRDSITSKNHILTPSESTKSPSLQSLATEEQHISDYIKSL
ncbi:hypothetical protein DSO57_1024553 [Entomophthora muscae]|uniref:Uncharacterized protein n=1 Tax=Entomophthora muscae TaxID=34485 RepID=A0ACC2UNF4_9FUNG|nr:hypothetical protein DSO57_1024553 [Entomophthora muscae]